MTRKNIKVRIAQVIVGIFLLFAARMNRTGGEK